MLHASHPFLCNISQCPKHRNGLAMVVSARSFHFISFRIHQLHTLSIAAVAQNYYIAACCKEV